MIPMSEHMKVVRQLNKVVAQVEGYSKPSHHVGTKAHLIVLEIREILGVKDDG